MMCCFYSSSEMNDGLPEQVKLCEVLTSMVVHPIVHYQAVKAGPGLAAMEGISLWQVVTRAPVRCFSRLETCLGRDHTFNRKEHGHQEQAIARVNLLCAL